MAVPVAPLYQACAAAALAAALSAQTVAQDIRVDVDAREIGRRLAHTSVTISLPPGRPAGAATPLYFVEWTPGNHSPSGPIQNVVDLRIEDSTGAPVRWRRDETNVYRHIADPAPGADSITARFSYITNQPAVNSRSTDTSGFRDVGGLLWNTVLLYPEWADRTATPVAATCVGLATL